MPDAPILIMIVVWAIGAILTIFWILTPIVIWYMFGTMKECLVELRAIRQTTALGATAAGAEVPAQLVKPKGRYAVFGVDQEGQNRELHIDAATPGEAREKAKSEGVIPQRVAVRPRQ